MIYKVSERPVIIVIGQQGENDAENIQVDYTEWIKKYGSGIITAEYQRPDMSYPYPVTLTMADGIATWTVSETDVTWEDSGNGSCGKMTGFVQLVYKVGEIVKKTVIWPVQVNKSLGTSGPVPDPVQSWIDQMVELGAVVAENAAKAEQAAADAESYAAAAKASADNADAAAEAAAASAEAAATAKSAAETAQAAAEAAQTAAEQARSEAEAAETGAEDAQLAAEAAKSGAETAQAAAEAAAQSATAAQNAAEAARDAAQAAQTAAEAARDAAQQYAEEAAEAAVNALIPFLPVDSASGAIASFQDGADDIPVISLTAEIKPIQDLNGYANPWPAGGGKNLFDANAVAQGYYVSDGNGELIAGNASYASDYIEVDAGQTYRISPTLSSGNWGAWYDENKAFISGFTGFATAKTAPSNAKYLRFTVSRNGSNPNYATTTQVEKGSAASSWTPYKNTCPISGRTEAVVTHVGKNLFNAYNWEVDSSARDRWIINSESSMTLRNVAYIENLNRYNLQTADSCVFSAHIKSLESLGDTALYLRAFDVNDRLLAEIRITAYPTGYETDIQLKIPNGTAYIKFAGWAYSGLVEFSKIQIEIGENATEFEQYKVETIQATWESDVGTVYGGDAETVSGGLTDDTKMVDMGALTWSKNAYVDTAFNTPIADMARSSETYGDPSNLVSSEYAASNIVGAAELKNGEIMVARSSQMLVCRDDRFSTAAEFKAAVSGVQLCYKRAEPIKYDLPGQEVKTYYGTNNFWNDAGNTAVVYRADIQKYIDKKTGGGS